MAGPMTPQAKGRPTGFSGAFPKPISSLLVFLGWILIMGDLSLLVLLGALLFAWGLPRLALPFAMPVAGPSDWMAAARLVVVVLIDIVKSNLVVARLVLGDPARLRPAFVTVPLASDHPHVANLLASIITMTPGTVSAVVNEPVSSPTGNGVAHPGSIVVHVLDCDDQAELVADIKARYEKPLMEIFGC